MPILKIEKLTKKYGKTYALNGLAFCTAKKWPSHSSVQGSDGHFSLSVSSFISHTKTLPEVLRRSLLPDGGIHPV